MKTTTVVFALLFLFSLPGGLSAEPMVWDDLLKGVDRAGKELAQGKDRQEVLDRLDLVIEKHSPNGPQGLVKKLRDDLAESIRNAAARPKGDRGLMDTTLPPHLIAHPANWAVPLTQFLAKNPNDPMAAVMQGDRSVIGTLLPQLRDTSPTRSYEEFGFGDEPRIPRMCDLAILAIEYHSKCRFHFNASSGTPFHELSGEERDQKIQHMEKWWEENQGKTLSDGIRSQLPHADFYGKVGMASHLAGMGDNTPENSDRADGLEVLRGLVRENGGYHGAYAANVLAKFGDYSPVDQFYARLKKSIETPGLIHDSHVVFYLTDYGTRREWEVLHTLAQREISAGLNAGAAPIWPALVNCKKAKSSLWAIPGLALALTQTDESGSRFVADVGSQSFSYADTAIEHLQILTKKDFGYQRAGTPEERSAAIRKAKDWWESEGCKTYTFDKIEALMKTGAKQSLKQDTP